MSYPHFSNDCATHHDLVCDFGGPRPRIVVLCGSTRFFDAFRRENLRATLDGKIVLSIGCDTRADADIAEIRDMTQAKAGLDELHKRKIDLADEVLVLNVAGYIGPSTRSEIEYAEKRGKSITYLVGGDLPLDMSYTAILARAADRIEKHGLAVDDYTTPVEDVDADEWPADLQGSVAAAIGYPASAWETEAADSTGFRPAREVADLLVDRLGLDPVLAWDESLGGWSDERTAVQVVARLREIAADMSVPDGGEAA